MVFDDGVTTRLGEQHYLMTTTTGNAAAVLAWLEEWLQMRVARSRCLHDSVTEQWATVALAGPRSREVLQAAGDRHRHQPRGVAPISACARRSVAGIPARIFRISFTGELSYEINVAAPITGWRCGRR